MLRVLRRARQRLTGVSVVYLLASVVTSVRVSVTRSVYVSSRPSGRRMTMSYAPTLAGKRTVPRAGPIALGQSCGPLGTPAKYKSMWLPLELRDIPSGSRQLKVRLVVATMYSDGPLSRAEANQESRYSPRIKGKESLTAWYLVVSGGDWLAQAGDEHASRRIPTTGGGTKCVIDPSRGDARLLGRRRTQARPCRPFVTASTAASAKSSTAPTAARTLCSKRNRAGRRYGSGVERDGPEGRGGNGGVPAPTAVGADAREGRAQRLPASAARTPLGYPNPCSQPGPCAYPAACSSEASFPFSYAHARPNRSRLSCGRPARQRKGGGRSPCPARGTTLRFLESDHRPAASSACWAARPRTSSMNPFRTAPSVEHVVDASSDRSLRRTRPRSPSDARVVARSTKRTRPHP